MVMDTEVPTTVLTPAQADWRHFESIRHQSSARDVTRGWRPRWLIMVVLVYAALAVIVMRPVTDPDLWWHLRTGAWILEHRAVPWTDPFSSYGYGKPWVAYSWLFEIGLSALYDALGLFGPLLYVTVVALAITVALQRFMMHFEGRLTRSAALTVLGVGAMGSIIMPRSYLFSILFFIVELHVLFVVRESGRARPLLLLPPLFALWANLHVLFIYGLLALGFAVFESLVQHFLPGKTATAEPRSPLLGPLLLTALASAAATLLTPYHLHLHASVLGLARQAGVYDWVIDVTAMDFRQPGHWLVLALTLGAAFLLGRQQRLRLFPSLLLILGVVLAFRARRDMWVVVVAALAIIAECSPGRTRHEGRLTWRWVCAGVIGIVLAFAGLGLYRDVSPRGVEAAVAREYPVAAAQIVEARGYQGPLFNTYDWGGYLIWRLPQLPVAMDGRSNIHGDYRIARSIGTWFGARTWASDPELAAANLVIAPINVALTSLLRLDPRFELAYEDDVAAVFVARRASHATETKTSP
jgi:hypothetical protein